MRLAAVKMSIRYIADRHLPDKAIDLMMKHLTGTVKQALQCLRS